MKGSFPDAKPKSYYRPVPGSRELITAGQAESPEIQALSKATPGPDGLVALHRVAGDLLGGAKVEADFVAVPLSVFDRLALQQTPLEQAVYHQLVRLAYGEGRNYCWAGKRELMRRCRLSERRLHVVLDGLVEKGHLRPLGRQNRGTLYRVLLPAEILDGRSEPGVRLAEKAVSGEAIGNVRRKASDRPNGFVDTTKNVDSNGIGKKDLPLTAGPPQEKPPVKTVPSARAKAPKTGRSQGGQLPEKPKSAKPQLRERPLESPLNEERFADLQKSGRTVSVSEIANSFFQASGVKPSSEERDAAISEITSLLEDGFAREEIQRGVEWYGRKFKNSRKLDRLAYYIHQALLEK